MESSINKIIPPEILEMILLKLETQDLLRCRSVSKPWKTFASPICRGRYVAPNFRGVFSDAEETEAFFATFENSSDLPWSACSIVRYKCHKSVKRFVDAFGPHLRKLKLHGDNLVQTIVPALNKFPNLEILIYDIKTIVKHIRKACAGNSSQLPRLKRLEIVIHTKTDVQLMEFLCKNTPNLESVEVNFKGQYISNIGKLAQDDLRRMISAVSGIPSITLNLADTGTVESFQTLSAPELKLKELKFDLPYEDPTVPDEGPVKLEQFLQNNSNCLEKLKITEEFETTELFRLPILFKLKELELFCGYISSPTLTSSLHPFVANQFPSLVKVTTQVREVTGEDFTTVFGTVQFNSVKELEIESYLHPNPMVIDWGHIFPNLVKLTLIGVTVESHSYIYEKITKLEYLSLNVCPWDVCVRRSTRVLPDPNAIICGYPKNNEKNCENAQERSLSSLKNLKKLFLDFDGCRKRDYPNSKVHLALLQLHRLDSLTFRNIKISTEVKKKLSDYHGEVKVETAEF